MNRRASLLWLERGLFVAGIVLLAVWLENYVEARVFQARTAHELDAALTEARFVGPPAPETFAHKRTPSRLERGVLGRIEIPRLAITAMVAEGTDEDRLKRAVGHVPMTALPGEAGNVGLAGHRDSFLRGLGDVRENDVVRLVTLRGTYTYHVEWSAVVEPSRTDVLATTAVRSLTLVTCYPFQAVGPAPQRFVVRARQVEPTASLP